MLVCRVGAERYAFDLDLLREVRLPTGLTPVPCTPPFVAGVLNVRGEILTVLDLAALLDLPRRDAPPPSARAALVQLPEARVGLLVDEVLGVERIALDRLHRPLSGREYVRGVAEANLVCLNLRLLLTPARFKVAEEVG